MQPPIIFRSSKRIILRPLTKTDIPLLVRWMNDPDITTYLMRTRPISFEEEERWIESLSKRENNDVVLGIQLVNGFLIGTIGLHSISWVDGTATTGTIIGEPEHRRKGYAFDAKMLILHYAFDTLHLRKICSSVLAHNEASTRYAISCGYKREGRRKKQVFRNGVYYDEILFAVWRHTWLPIYKKWCAQDMWYDTP